MPAKICLNESLEFIPLLTYLPTDRAEARVGVQLVVSARDLRACLSFPSVALLASYRGELLSTMDR